MQLVYYVLPYPLCWLFIPAEVRFALRQLSHQCKGSALRSGDHRSATNLQFSILVFNLCPPSTPPLAVMLVRSFLSLYEEIYFLFFIFFFPFLFLQFRFQELKFLRKPEVL